MALGRNGLGLKGTVCISLLGLVVILCMQEISISDVVHRLYASCMRCMHILSLMYVMVHVYDACICCMHVCVCARVCINCIERLYWVHILMCTVVFCCMCVVLMVYTNVVRVDCMCS